MKESVKQNLKEKMDSIEKEFNRILKEKGLEGYTIQNFKILETQYPQAPSPRPRRCLEWRWVCRNDGTCYRRCVRWS